MERPLGSKNKPKHPINVSNIVPEGQAGSYKDTEHPVAHEPPLPKPRVVWTEKMVETLLELRVNQFALAFACNKSRAQLKVFWHKITCMFNIGMKTDMEASQIQNKYSALIKEFDDIGMFLSHI